jgi:hypothetical protein
MTAVAATSACSAVSSRAIRAGCLAVKDATLVITREPSFRRMVSAGHPMPERPAPTAKDSISGQPIGLLGEVVLVDQPAAFPGIARAARRRNHADEEEARSALLDSAPVRAHCHLRPVSHVGLGSLLRDLTVAIAVALPWIALVEGIFGQPAEQVLHVVVARHRSVFENQRFARRRSL